MLGFGNQSGFGHAPKVDWRPGPYNGGGYADLWGNDIEGQLSPLGFLLYWLGCFAFTITAVFIALADVKALRVRTQREQKDLLESTLKEIKTGASSRTGDGKPGYISDGKNSSTSNLN